MAILWIINLLAVVAIIPVVVILLGRLLTPVKRIHQQVNGLDGRAASLLTLLDAVNELPRTQQLVRETGAGLGRYGAALDKIL